MKDVVYAVDTANVMMPDESMVFVQRGQPLPADAEVVRFKPFLFSADSDLWAQSAPTSIGPNGQPVEQATANPGEKRSVRRG